MRRLALTLATTGLLAGGVALAPAQAAPSPVETALATVKALGPAALSTHVEVYTPPPIVWGSCGPADFDELGFQCGFLIVPLDYDSPGGSKIALKVTRIRHTVPDAQYQGVMLTNPGGPGGSGVILPILTYFVPGDAGFAYDWVGFDPRGVGLSPMALL